MSIEMNDRARPHYIQGCYFVAHVHLYVVNDKKTKPLLLSTSMDYRTILWGDGIVSWQLENKTKLKMNFQSVHHLR